MISCSGVLPDSSVDGSIAVAGNAGACQTMLPLGCARFIPCSMSLALMRRLPRQHRIQALQTVRSEAHTSTSAWASR